MHEAEEIFHNESLDTEQHSRPNVIKQQLEGKLKLLNDMDKDILQHCEVDAIETEIEESDNVIARIINCNQRIESIVSLISSIPTSTGLSTLVLSTAPHSKPRLSKLSLRKF